MVRRACVDCGHIVRARADDEEVQCPNCEGYDFEETARKQAKAKPKAKSEAARKKAEEDTCHTCGTARSKAKAFGCWTCKIAAGSSGLHDALMTAFDQKAAEDAKRKAEEEASRKKAEGEAKRKAAKEEATRKKRNHQEMKLT